MVSLNFFAGKGSSSQGPKTQPLERRERPSSAGGVPATPGRPEKQPGSESETNEVNSIGSFEDCTEPHESQTEDREAQQIPVKQKNFTNQSESLPDPGTPSQSIPEEKKEKSRYSGQDTRQRDSVRRQQRHLSSSRLNRISVYDKIQELELRNSQLKDRCRFAEKLYNERLDEIDTLRAALEQQTLRADSCSQDKIELESKFEELHVAHVKSVNSTSSGLDPISDQVFESRFRGLHDEVGEWCRKAYKKGNALALDEIDPDTKILLEGRILQTGDLNFKRLIETMVWAFTETFILSVWFPTLTPECHEFLLNVHEQIRKGDSTETLERSDYWRAYTASMLFQNPEQQRGFKDLDWPATHLLGYLATIQIKPMFNEEYLPSIQKILKSIKFLAGELKCQRAVYEMDVSVHIGDRYDESRMTNLNFDDEEPGEGAHAVVSSIISRGWVKRKHSGSTEISNTICKARVFVEIQPTI